LNLFYLSVYVLFLNNFVFAMKMDRPGNMSQFILWL